MEIARFIVGVVLPYIAIVVFVGGMAYRLYTWKKLVSPPMTLFPAPSDEKSNTVNTIQEVVLFRSLFRGDRLLWVLAWVFHAVLLLIFVGHFRVFTGMIDSVLQSLGMSEDAIKAMSGWAGGAAGVLILLATVLLTPIRRIRPNPGLETPGAVRSYNFNLAVDPDLLWQDLRLAPRYGTIFDGIPAVAASKRETDMLTTRLR